MVKLISSLTHCKMRDGRPRFSPGPKVRALGFKGEDLRHVDFKGRKTGAWFTQAEALAWATAKETEINARREAVKVAKASGQRVKALRIKPSPTSTHLTVEDLFETWMDSPRMQGKTIKDGKRTQKAVAPATREDYRKKIAVLAAFDPEIYGAPAESLSQPIVYDLYERLWQARGLATARGSVAVLSAAVSWGLRRGRLPRLNGVNPCLRLGMETPDARVRALTIPEVFALITAADEIQLPEIGDATMLGVWTGQRQIDRLLLDDGGVFDNRRRFVQSKTKAVVEIKRAPELEMRLEAAKARRAAWTIQPTRVVVYERAGELQPGKDDWRAREPFKSDWYRHCFAKVRAHAVKTMPSLADARDQDLRDTAVTWLTRAQCSAMEIAQITGHSLESIHQILKHYLSQHREIGDNAIDKMVKWFDEQQEGASA